MSADYDGTVEQVHRAFADKQYWLARLADSGADDATLDGLHVDTHGSIAVTTTQVLHSDRLPGLVTQFHRGNLRIRRRETWSPVRANIATAQVSGEIEGAPVALSGDGALSPASAGTGSLLVFHGSVEVRIPLVGGKVESFISGQLADLLIAEQRFTSQWLRDTA